MRTLGAQHPLLGGRRDDHEPTTFPVPGQLVRLWLQAQWHVEADYQEREQHITTAAAIEDFQLLQRFLCPTDRRKQNHHRCCLTLPLNSLVTTPDRDSKRT